MKDAKYRKIKNYVKGLEKLSQSSDDYFYILDLQTTRGWFLGGVEERFDIQKSDPTAEWFEANDWIQIAHPNDREALEEDIKSICIGQKTTHAMSYRVRTRKGQYIWINCRGSVEVDEEGTPFILVGRISEAALWHRIDVLTGVFNYEQMKEDLQQVLLEQRAGFFLVFGIDNLRIINTRYGRSQGDKAIRLLGKTLEETVGNRNTYRLSTDLFATYMLNTTEEDVRKYYAGIQKEVAAYFTVSMGAVSLNLPNLDIIILQQYAEFALGKAKSAGKNQMTFFEPVEYQKEETALVLLGELEECVEHNCQGFYLVYQPQVKVGSYTLFGAEALLRYTSPTRGTVYPDEFIPLLEKSELIVPVGLWTLETALKDCKLWREKNPEFHISVNVSYAQLTQPDISEQFLGILKRSGVPGHALTLEVTESMQLNDFEYFNQLFLEWRKEGIHISVDDFGTGYCNLSYLKNLYVDEIKIDQIFAKDIQNSSYDYRLLSNVIELATSSQLRVCCEGVETIEQLRVLEELKPNVIQGYLFSKPCDRDTFEKMYFSSESSEYEQYQKRLVEVKKSHIGELLNIRHREILRATGLGLWTIRIVDDGNAFEMYINDTMKQSMGLDKNLTPEECYAFWHQRIQEDCVDYVDSFVKQLITSKSAIQAQYFWKHPKDGVVDVRCIAVRTEDIDGGICLQGCHINISQIKCTTFVEKDFDRLNSSYQNLQTMDQIVIRGLELALEEVMPEASIQALLEYLGRSLGSDRVYIFERDEKNYDSNTYEWTASGVMPERDNLQNLPPEICDSWYRTFGKGEDVLIDDIEKIKEEEPFLHGILRAQEIHSVAVVPLKHKGKLVGFCGMDNPQAEFFEHSHMILKIISQFIVLILNRREVLHELWDLGHKDTLTNCGNRLALSEYCDALKPEESIAIIYCDVNGLKHTNDHFGHEEGDRLILSACEVLLSVFDRKHIFRLGGDEFLILCPSIEEAEMYARIEELKLKLKKTSMVLAIGSAYKEHFLDGTTIEQLFREAERSMYADKEAYYSQKGLDRRRC